MAKTETALEKLARLDREDAARKLERESLVAQAASERAEKEAEFLSAFMGALRSVCKTAADSGIDPSGACIVRIGSDGEVSIDSLPKGKAGSGSVDVTTMHRAKGQKATLHAWGLNNGDRIRRTFHGVNHELTVIGETAVSYCGVEYTLSGAGRVVFGEHNLSTASCQGPEFWLGHESVRVLRGDKTFRVAKVGDGFRLMAA